MNTTPKTTTTTPPRLANAVANTIRRVSYETLTILTHLIYHLNPNHTNTPTGIWHATTPTMATINGTIIYHLAPPTPPHGPGTWPDTIKHLIACAYHHLPHGLKTHYATYLGVDAATIKRWRATITYPLVETILDCPLKDGLTQQLWDQLDACGTPIPKTALTPQIKRLIVTAYKLQTRYTKAEFLARLGIGYTTMKNWEAALADGSLAAMAVPRRTGTITTATAKELFIMDQQHRDKDRHIQQLEQEVQTWKKAAQALGKALNAMPGHNGQHGKDAAN